MGEWKSGKRKLNPAKNPAVWDTLTWDVSSASFHEAYSIMVPGKLPKTLRMVPRLGIGTCMSKTVWPGIWQALNACSFCANGIQNSLRELNLLEKVQKRKVTQKLYDPGIGFVPESHTGSTFEGRWLCGVSEASQ